MFCTNCGKQLEPNATACPSCGTRVRRFPLPPEIPTYLVPSILVTFCCCLPFGIVAVVYAAQVNSKLAAGDIAGAQASSKNAKMWAWISFATGIVLTMISIALNLVNVIGQK